MECPHCANDTSELLKYCEFCGSELELDGDQAGSALSRETSEDRFLAVVRKRRTVLFGALFGLACLMAMRFVILRDQPVTVRPVMILPPSLVEQKTGANAAYRLPLDKIELPYPSEQ